MSARNLTAFGATALLLIVTGLALAGVHADRPAPGHAPVGASAVLRPGIERALMDALAPLRGSELGGRVGDVRIDRDVARVTLRASPGADPSCRFAGQERVELTHAGADAAGEVLEGAIEARAGSLIGRLCMCGDAASVPFDSIVAQVEAAGAAELWSAPSGGDRSGGDPVERRGMVGPVAAASALTPASVVELSFAIAALGLAFAAWRTARGRAAIASGESPMPDRTARAVAVVAVGVGLALRLWRAASSQEDGDESWAMPNPTQVFSDTHDAWVHPPLGRALARLWLDASDWSAASGLFALRAPSLMLGACGLLLLGALAWRRGSIESAIAVVLVACGQAATEVDALARPYALVGLAWACLVIATSERRAAPWSVFVAGLAVMTCVWTDVLAGAVALAWFALWMVRAGDRIAAGAALSGVSAGCAALIPGVLAAATGHVQEDVAGPHADLATRGEDIVPVALEVIGAVAPGGLAVLGAAIFAGAIAMAWRRGAKAEAVLAGLILVGLLVIVPFIALRARNVAFLAWLVAAMWLARGSAARGDSSV